MSETVILMPTMRAAAQRAAELADVTSADRDRIRAWAPGESLWIDVDSFLSLTAGVCDETAPGYSADDAAEFFAWAFRLTGPTPAAHDGTPGT